MKKLSILPELEEKIYDLKIENDVGLSQITTYFPLSSEGFSRYIGEGSM